MALLTEKGWTKLSNQAEVKEGELQALFNMIDRDGSGELSLEEARKACKLIQARFNISEVIHDFHFKTTTTYHQFTFLTQVDDWMNQVDSNQDGKLSYDEFMKSLDGKISICE